MRNNGKVTFSDAAMAMIAIRIKELKIDVVVFDPLVALHGLPEGDNTNITKMLRAMDHKIAKPCNCSIDVVHHTRKPAAGQQADLSVDDIRGAGGIVYSVRSGRLLIPMSAAEANKYGVPTEERGSYFRIERAKANMAKKGTICWIKLVEHPLQNGPGGSYGDVVTVPELWTPTDMSETVSDTMATAIREEIGRGSGQYRRDMRATNWAGKLIAARLNLDLDTSMGKAQAKLVLASLIKKGVLRVETHPDKNGDLREYVLAGNKWGSTT